MGRALFSLLVILAACSAPLAGEDFIKVPRGGSNGAGSWPEADAIAAHWCEKQGREAVRDDDGDRQYFRYACR